MHENAIQVVNQYKNHPAVLTWGIGNEVYLNMATDPEKEAYSKLLEKICRKIKEIDPNHPITSVEAWTFGIKWWEQYVPSIDIYGINCYGPGANVLPDELKKLGVNKPLKNLDRLCQLLRQMLLERGLGLALTGSNEIIHFILNSFYCCTQKYRHLTSFEPTNTKS